MRNEYLVPEVDFTKTEFKVDPTIEVAVDGGKKVVEFNQLTFLMFSTSKNVKHVIIKLLQQKQEEGTCRPTNQIFSILAVLRRTA